MIEGDFTNCFDSIDHQLLINLLENKILDRQFTKLIQKCLHAGYFEFKVFSPSLSGVPQGTILSPILANIFLHQLDEFIIRLKDGFNKGNKAKATSEYEHIRYLQKKEKKIGNMQKVLKYDKQLLSMNPIDHSEESFKNMQYVRYADDWLIGIKGSKEEAVEILNKVINFCEIMKLEINQDQSKITNLRGSKACFLGVNINRSTVQKYAKMKLGCGQRLKQRLRLTVSIDRVIRKLTEAQFMKNGKAYPKFIWLPLNHDQIVHRYNTIFRGYINYYSFVHNYSKMVGILTLILKRSLAKLLATKFTLRTQAAAYKKFGSLLSGPKVSFIKSKYKSNYMNFKIQSKDYIEGLYSKSKSLASGYHLKCVLCDSNYRVEMHPIKHMKDINNKLGKTDNFRIRANIKQIPFCRKCHMEYHRETGH